MRKKKHKKYGHKHGSFCVWRPNIKIFFDLIELNIKMSSVSNVSEDNSRSEEFSLKNIEELVDSEGQNWFKKAYVGKFLGLRYTDTSVGSLDKWEMPSSAPPPPPPPSPHGTRVWPGPKDHQNKTDKFLSVFGVMYVIIKSQKRVKRLRNIFLKILYHAGLMQKLKRSRESIDWPLKKKMQQLHCSITI